MFRGRATAKIYRGRALARNTYTPISFGKVSHRRRNILFGIDDITISTRDRAYSDCNMIRFCSKQSSTKWFLEELEHSS